jgi:hypothetical protein
MSTGEEFLQGVIRVPKLLDVGDESTHLHRIDEILWGSLPPPVEGFVGGQSVESVVEFYSGEFFGIELQPLGLWETFRIEAFSPVVV